MGGMIRCILALVYPRFCKACGGPLPEGERFFCLGCLGGVEEVGEPGCTTCGRPFSGGAGGGHDCWECMKKRPPYGIARAPVSYSGVVKEAIHLYKYGRIRPLGGFLGGYIEEGARRWFAGSTVAVPVPLHKARLRERGFNQSLFLASRAACVLGITLSVDGLARIRNTRPQVELGPGEREKNVRGAFAVSKPGGFRGERVLLIDDVYTTGATVKECSKVLLKAGADRVDVLTVARVV